MSHSSDPDGIKTFDTGLAVLFIIVVVVVFLVMVAPMLGDGTWQFFGSLLSWLLSLGH